MSENTRKLYMPTAGLVLFMEHHCLVKEWKKAKFIFAYSGIWKVNNVKY